jgi:hypothetical protein
MQKITRFYCCSWGLLNKGRPVSYACPALLLGLVLSGCGGGGDSSHQTASAPALASSVQKDLSGPNRMAAQSPTLESGKPALSATADKPVVVSPEESARLAQLRALPLLSSLSERERAGLLKQLPPASSSERLTLINGYPKLAVVPDRQKQVLLTQMEKIVPVTISANLLICNCSDDIQLKLCVKERCSNRSELQSICNRACGTLAAFKSQCLTSEQCARE